MPRIENMILANHAEAINGMLYLMGAGWDHAKLGPEDEQGNVPPFHLGLGLTILIAWQETNQRHELEIWLESEDGGKRLFEMKGQVEVGRPPGIPPGSDQRAAIAVNGNISLAEGGYRFVGLLGDAEHRRTVSFRAVRSRDG